MIKRNGYGPNYFPIQISGSDQFFSVSWENSSLSMAYSSALKGSNKEIEGYEFYIKMKSINNDSLFPAVVYVKILNYEIYEGPTFHVKLEESYFLDAFGLEMMNLGGGHKILLDDSDESYGDVMFSIGECSKSLNFRGYGRNISKLKLGDNQFIVAASNLGWNGTSVDLSITSIREVKIENVEGI